MFVSPLQWLLYRAKLGTLRFCVLPPQKCSSLLCGVVVLVVLIVLVIFLSFSLHFLATCVTYGFACGLNTFCPHVYPGLLQKEIFSKIFLPRRLCSTFIVFPWWSTAEQSVSLDTGFMYDYPHLSGVRVASCVILSERLFDLSHSLGCSKICLVLMPSSVGGAAAYPNAQINLDITTVGICGTPVRLVGDRSSWIVFANCCTTHDRSSLNCGFPLVKLKLLLPWCRQFSFLSLAMIYRML